MAEPTPAPVLPSTADPVPYVPVSWMAVAAITVAGLFVVVLLALGVSAFLAKKPIVQPELLALPAVGIVLSFAARRVIRNAEGTRTGERLANNAWWICLVAGLGYAAYLLAIDFAIRRDARRELEQWLEKIKAGDDASLLAAFHRTRDPAIRPKIRPDDRAQLEGRFGLDLIAFEQSDLVRLAQRNAGACEVTIGSVREWAYRGGGIECSYGAELKCPEGKFPLAVGLRGSEPTGESAGRQWGVVFTGGAGYIVRERQTLTPYGWLLTALEQSGGQYGNQFLTSVQSGPASVPYAYQAMMATTPRAPEYYWSQAASTAPARGAVVGAVGHALPFTADFVAYSFPDQFFKAPGGGEPSAERRAMFKTVWEAAGILPAGGRLRNTPDTRPLVVVAGDTVEVKVPCELPFPGQDTSVAARGRLVVASAEPALAAELRRLRDEANPDRSSAEPPQDLRTREFRWRVVRVESDMARFQMPRSGEEGPGGPPMPATSGVPSHP